MCLSGRVVFPNDRVAFRRFQCYFRDLNCEVRQLEVFRVGPGVDAYLMPSLLQISSVLQAFRCARVDRLLCTLVGDHAQGVTHSYRFRGQGTNIINGRLRGLLIWDVWLVVSRFGSVYFGVSVSCTGLTVSPTVGAVICCFCL